MKKYLAQFAGSAGLAYTAANLIYGNSEYANVGFTLIPADFLQKILPIIVGILYPLLQKKWPDLFSKIKGVAPDFDSEITETLDLLNKLELSAAKSGNSESIEACQTLREQTLQRVRNDEEV